MHTPTFMIIPSLACQASCKYCFGPHAGAVMDEKTARETIRFIRRIVRETGGKKIDIIFHGGEPLLAPFPVWEALFDEIDKSLGDYPLSLNLQSNLWQLDDAFLTLFKKYNVSLGTSLDGPQELCDINRGTGYYNKTYGALKKANNAGLPVSAIATITKQTKSQVKEIVTFFRDQGLSLVLHGALASMDKADSPYALTADDYAEVIKTLFPWYVDNRKTMRIDTLDQYVRGLINGQPSVCTFKDCLGMFLAISPTGDITSCQRLAGRDDFRLGNIFEPPTDKSFIKALYNSPAARQQESREAAVKARCGACDVYALCKGGCYYNAVVSGDGVVDTLCEAYKSIYAFVQDRLFTEMASEENLRAIAEAPVWADGHPLFRKGDTISLADEIHPQQIADHCRQLLALHMLSVTGDPEVAAHQLYTAKICGDVKQTEKLLTRMQNNLYTGENALNNCYIHVTWDCNLRCSHCYAEGGEQPDEMEMNFFAQLLTQSIEAGFRQLIITGGEPLVHTQRRCLLALCKATKGQDTNLVLRTNLTGIFSDRDLTAMAEAFDQVVVSVDGNEKTHDKRRGSGTYANVHKNLQRYQRLAKSIPGAGELSLACVMDSDSIVGEPGESVRSLAKELQVKRVRFRPLLPLGRGSHMEEPVMSERLFAYITPEEHLKIPIRPLTTCGIGQNLYIEPRGDVYPCYAWCHAHTFLGNAFDAGLEDIIGTAKFKELAACTVDTVKKCRDCEYRYLCGGACRAWGNQNNPDINAPPVDCSHLQKRAEDMLRAASNYLGIRTNCNMEG